MTTSWPSAPAGQSWQTLDPLLGSLFGVVEHDAPLGEVHQIRWEPPKRAAVTYRRPHAVRAGGDGGGVVSVEVTRDGTTSRTLLSDDALPGVGAALDPEEVRRRLEPVWGSTLTVNAITPASYRPGSRVVLRVDVADALGPHELYVKVFADGDDRFARVAVALTAAGLVAGLPVPVPPVLDRWLDLRAVLTAGVPGPTLSRRLTMAGTQAERRGIAFRLGDLLAVVASTPLATLPTLPAAPPVDDLLEVDRCLPATWYGDPVNAASLARLRDDLAANVPDGEEEGFGHGSFRPGQVVDGPDGLTLLDLDGACLAQPGRDLGNVRAHLAWQALRSSLAPHDTRALLDAVLEGYEARGGRADDDALRWWQAVAMARIAARRYRSLATGEWALSHRLVRSAGRLLDGDDAPSRRSLLASASVGGVTRPCAEPGPVDPELLDPAAMTSHLARAFAFEGKEAVTVTSAQVLGAAAGRRVVLRYLVSGLAPRPVPVVAKVFAERQRAQVTYRNLVALGEESVGPVEGTAPLAPLAVLPRLGMVLYAESPGRLVCELIEDDALDAVRIGVRWLRAVHDSAASLDRRFDLGHELDDVAAWAAEVVAHHPCLRRRTGELVQRLRERAAELPVVPEGPVHKDFHPGHLVLREDGRVTVIDLDEARSGDPAIDLAHLVTHLEESRRPWAGRARDAVLEEYGELAGGRADDRVSFYAAYTRMKMAKQLVRGSGPLAPEWGAVRADDLALLLERGSSCGSA
ncbi:MAG: phosphotransferase [Actinomycetes bacterium]